MICLHHFIIVPLLFCICHLTSACHLPGTDKTTVQPDSSVDFEPTQESQTPGTVQRPVRNGVWIGEVNQEDPLDSAADIYSNSPSNPPGVYEHKGLVICIVEIPLSEDFDDDDDFSFEIEMEAKMETFHQLQKVYNLSSISRLEARGVDNQIDDDVYRCVMAFRLKDIQALQASEGNAPAEK